MIRWVFMVDAFLCTCRFGAASPQVHNSRLATDPNKQTDSST